MNAKAVYAPFQEAVTAMNTAADIFQTAWMRNKNGQLFLGLSRMC